MERKEILLPQPGIELRVDVELVRVVYTPHVNKVSLLNEDICMYSGSYYNKDVQQNSKHVTCTGDVYFKVVGFNIKNFYPRHIFNC